MTNQMRNIAAGPLSVAYRECGPADGPAAILLHGFPYDIHAYDTASQTLSEHGFRCVVPYLRGYGPTRFTDARTPRSGEQAALGADLLALMDALSIDTALIGGYDWGGRAACVVAALWPERVKGLVSCGSGYNIQNIAAATNPAPPEQELRFWYQHYFQTERGRRGLTSHRESLCALLWKLWSPTWRFDQATFERSAAAFANPDFVEVVIHSYRHRYGNVPGDPALAGIEAQLATQPPIAVPTVVLHGHDDGVDPIAQTDRDAKHFIGPYQRKILPGVGHNLPQEAPTTFVEAMLSLR